MRSCSNRARDCKRPKTRLLQGPAIPGGQMNGKHKVRMSAPAVARACRISPRTLARWCTGSDPLLRVSGGGRKGKAREFTISDAVRALTISELRRQGAPLSEIRAAIRTLARRYHVKDWQHRWLAVGNQGRVVWLDDADDVMEEVRSGQRFLIDVSELQSRARGLENRRPSEKPTV